MGYKDGKHEVPYGAPRETWPSTGLTENPFERYIPKDVAVMLSIAGERFESIVKENVIRPYSKGGMSIETRMVPEEVPEILLDGVSREAFVAKFHARLGKDWGCTFFLQEDGSYAADDIFLRNVADVVSRVKREQKS